ncbi:hypothetical protein BS630_00770 [Rhizobium laguerreae]|nr:hypothetical protein BS630_00770 [Rhizobium laguerreae]
MGSFQIGVEGEGGYVLDYPRISLASSRLETNMVRFICKSALALGARVRRGLRPARDSLTVDCTI